VLSDPQKRKNYDLFGHRGAEGIGGFGDWTFGTGGFGDIFEDIFSISQQRFGLAFDASLHLGTLVAVAVFFIRIT